MLKRFFVGTIRARILLPVAASLILSIFGLSYFILSIQQDTQDNMTASLKKRMEEESTQIRTDLQGVKNQMQNALHEMAAKSTDKLAKSSKAALEQEASVLGEQLEKSLLEGADSMALLMARMAPPAILSKDFASLLSYVKAINQNSNVIFALFFDADGRLLTRYLDRNNSKIKQYLEMEGKSKNKIDRAITGANQDPEVFIVEKSVLVDNQPIGKVMLCIGKSAALQQIKALSGRFDSLVEENNSTITSVIQEESQLVTDEIGKKFGSIIQRSEKARDTVVENIDAVSLGAASKIRRVIILGGAACIALILAIVTLVTSQIMTAIRRLVKVSDNIAEGDFDQVTEKDRIDEIGSLNRSMEMMIQGLQAKAALAGKIASGNLCSSVDLRSERDALGHALQNMVGSLNDVLSRVHEASARLTSGSDQVAGASQSLSQGATEQASSLEEISSSMTELGSRTRTNAENAAAASQLGLDARQAARDGNDQMQQMVSSMNEINESSREIAKIIKTIDDISFQTNLLALNAAVEAARAGKHGKGFAVVAQEVRNLASRSARAASETADLIEGSVGRVDKGMEIVEKTAQSLNAIVDSTTRVTDLIGEIAAASNEQAQGISQINQGLSQVEQVTQQNTAHAEQTAAAADELSGQAKVLQEILAKFRLTDQNGSCRELRLMDGASANERLPYSSNPDEQEEMADMDDTGSYKTLPELPAGIDEDGAGQA